MAKAGDTVTVYTPTGPFKGVLQPDGAVYKGGVAINPRTGGQW